MRCLGPGVGEQVPAASAGQGGQFQVVGLPVRVHGHVDHVVVAGSAAGDRHQPAVRRPVGLPGPLPVPADVGQAEVLADPSGGVGGGAQLAVALAEGDHLAGEAEQFGVVVDLVPVEPGQFVVLAVGVVVALLGPADLVAGEQHRDALAGEEDGEGVLHLPGAQLVDRGVVGGALGAAVPAVVVVGAVVVALAVGLVVLVVVGDQVGEGEAVVRGQEVDRGGGAAAGVEVG